MKGRSVLVLLWIAVLAVATAVSSYAQDRVDVVYLKNGSIIRGTIVEQIPNESIKIETADGSVFVFKISEIEKITKESSASSKTASEKGPTTPMDASYLIINPLGLLQYGPMVDLEFRITPKLYGIAHIRLQGLGLLAHILATDEMAYWSSAVGTGVRYFFTQSGTPNAPYVGFAAEVGYNPYYGNVGYTDEYKGSAVYLTFAANGGFRWRFNNFVVNVGGYLGAAPTIYSEWAYVKSPDVKQPGILDTTFVAMAELSIGWALR